MALAAYELQAGWFSLLQSCASEFLYRTQGINPANDQPVLRIQSLREKRMTQIARMLRITVSINCVSFEIIVPEHSHGFS